VPDARRIRIARKESHVFPQARRVRGRRYRRRVAVAFGAYSLANSSSGNASSASAASARAAGQAPNAGRFQGGQSPPGFGTPATGADAAKAKAAALAKYDGTAERVMKLSDGSFLAHVLSSNSEYHVRVSKDFKVTGAQQGGPGGRGGPPAGAPTRPGTSS
jgi:hypothetical protein